MKMIEHATTQNLKRSNKDLQNILKIRNRKRKQGEHHTPTHKEKGEVKQMAWEETDTLVHFYEDQDGNLYLKLPGGNIRRVKKEKEKSLRKSLKEIGYQPTPIKMRK